MIDQIVKSPFATREQFDHLTRSIQGALSDGFESMLSSDFLSFELYEHQRDAVCRVMSDMNGRAILADEVGLGKTIEAGTVLKAYIARGIVKRALILVPASLVGQWKSELKERFDITPLIASRPDEFIFDGCVVASIDTAKRESMREVVQSRPWDMVIVDEAHRLKNKSTLNWRFVNGIEKTYLLLLTATPIQNNLEEIFNLVTLLKPGQLKTFAQFKRYFMIDKHRPRNAGALRKSLAEVMVRTTRKEAHMDSVDREIISCQAIPGEQERHFHNEVIRLAGEMYRAKGNDTSSVLPIIQMLRLAASHPAAAVFSLRKHVNPRRDTPRTAITELIQLSTEFIPAKLELIKKMFANVTESMIIFTQFRMTQLEIAKALAKSGLSTTLYHGGLNSDERSEALRAFREKGGVLISTDAGSEGINLQSARIVVNYDLPWNPMKIEQRIGRVHRIGQTRKVRVINVVTQDTIEAHILRVLEKKIGLFQLVIGEIDAVISRLEGGLTRKIVAEVTRPNACQDLRSTFDRIGDELARYRKEDQRIYAAASKWLD